MCLYEVTPTAAVAALYTQEPLCAVSMQFIWYVGLIHVHK